MRLYGHVVADSNFKELHTLVNEVAVPAALAKAGRAGRDESSRIARTRSGTGLMGAFLITRPVRDRKGAWIMWWTLARHAWIHDRGTHDGKIKPLNFLMRGRLHGKALLVTELGQALRRILS